MRGNYNPKSKTRRAGTRGGTKKNGGAVGRHTYNDRTGPPVKERKGAKVDEQGMDQVVCKGSSVKEKPDHSVQQKPENRENAYGKADSFRIPKPGRPDR